MLQISLQTTDSRELGKIIMKIQGALEGSLKNWALINPQRGLMRV